MTGDPFAHHPGDPRRCPFVAAVAAGDRAEVDRLNAADGDPAEPVVLAWLAARALQEVGGDRP